MDYNQDFAINRLHVLDDTNVTCDKNACAVFNGGIYVEKDIHAANIHIRNFKNSYISSTCADISLSNIDTANIKSANTKFLYADTLDAINVDISSADIKTAYIINEYVDVLDARLANINSGIFQRIDVSAGNFNEINVSKGIYPSDIFTTATIGSEKNKWNSIYARNGNFQFTYSDTCYLKNLTYENLITIPCIQNITNTFNPHNDWVVQLDKDIILINIYDIPAYTSNSLITIKIPESNINYEHHKIILSQIITRSNKYKIHWVIPGNPDFISDHSIQSFEIINLPHTGWKLIKYLQENTGYERIDTCFEEDEDEHDEDEDEHDEDECMLGMLKIQPRELKGTCISGCCVKKTFIKYVYKNKDIIDKKVIDQITSSIYDISLSLIQQAHHIKLLDQQIICPKIIDALGRKIDCMKDNILELETQCGYIDSEIRTHGSKIDNLHCNTRTSHSHSHNYNPTKLVEAIEDLSKIVKKNDKKMEELETKISNVNSKMKKIIKYLNLD
jgi:hypothetical protein